MSGAWVVLWAAVGGVLGFVVGRTCLVLERSEQVGDDAQPGERMGPSWIEGALLPLLGLVGFAAFAHAQGATWRLLVHSLWLVVLLLVLAFDLKHRLILDVVTFPALVLALVLAHWSPGLSVTSAIAGALFGGVVLLPLALASDLFQRGTGFGWGDVKLGMVIGAITGMSFNLDGLHTLWALIAGALVGGVVSVALLASRRLSLKDTIPYGPFLVAGAGLVLFFL
ncbi:MAG TPA: A24 family peptidase [Candidatus Micrarchaeia archaeon]|nr:A24 family peptidase [Candidatus Micrarchaeia archaeon]